MDVKLLEEGTQGLHYKWLMSMSYPPLLYHNRSTLTQEASFTLLANIAILKKVLLVLALSYAVPCVCEGGWLLSGC